MSGNLSLPFGKVFSQQAESRGIALLAAAVAAPRTPKTRETSILTKTTILEVGLSCPQPDPDHLAHWVRFLLSSPALDVRLPTALQVLQVPLRN